MRIFEDRPQQFEIICCWETFFSQHPWLTQSHSILVMGRRRAAHVPAPSALTLSLVTLSLSSNNALSNGAVGARCQFVLFSPHHAFSFLFLCLVSI
jgi:hypothetical protein